MEFFRSIRLPLAGLAAIAVLSGCGDNGNPFAPSLQLDRTPPPAPQGLKLAFDATGHSVLVWTESPAPDVAGYQMYVYSALPGGGNDYVPADNVISVDTSFRLPSVATSLAASYRVRAVDTSSNWSAFSAAVDLIIPATGGGGGGPGPIYSD